MPLSIQEIHPRSLESSYRRELSEFVNEKAVERLWSKDMTLWLPAEAAGRYSANLNWLDLPQRMAEYMPQVVAHAQQLETLGFETVVLVGMGGSNLAADTISRMSAATRPRRFIVLDSIDPSALRKLEAQLNWNTTLFVFVSKSGTVIEMHALLLYFLEKLRGHGFGQPGRHFIAVTEANSYLAQLAAEYRFFAVFLDPPRISGRFSSLIHFGLLLSGIGRVPPEVLSERAIAMQRACASDVEPKNNPALTLAALLAAGALDGMDRLFLAATPSLAAVTRSLAHLLGSSTGKDRQGIVPVFGEIPSNHERPCDHCMVAVLSLNGEAEDSLERMAKRLDEKGAPSVHIRIEGPEDLGAELFKWELATVLACSRLGVNPFDQPDAQRSRDAAQRQIIALATARNAPLPTVRVSEPGLELRAESATRLGISTHTLPESLRTFLELGSTDGYVAIMAFLEESAEVSDSLTRLRAQLEARLAIPVQLDFGPRYLHSLGQVHKGGPDKGLFVILTGEPDHDIPVPGAGYTFGRLQIALANGDFEALHQRNDRVLWLHLSENVTQGLAQLESSMSSALARLRRIA